MTSSGSGLRLLAAIFLIATAPASMADIAEAIGNCRAVTQPSQEVEFDLVVANCPGLVETIETSEWADAMPPAWQETLTLRELDGLGWFDSLYRDKTAGGNTRLPDTLERIVEELGDLGPAPDSRSLWERFTDWLRDRTGDDKPEAPGWLSEWLSDVELPTRAIEITFWVLTAIIIVAAIAVVVIEVRAARGGASRRFDQRPGGSAGDKKSGRRPPGLHDLESAAPEDKPSVLLYLLLEKLEQRGIAERRPSITHREVRNVASRLGQAEGQTLSAISLSAEEIRFGSRVNDPAGLEKIVSSGIALLEFLTPGRAAGA